jgi:hypothetical protein
MEGMESMNIFSALFGIFRQRGLVSLIRGGRSLAGFSISALVVSVIGGVLYGFAMGIGLGIETAIRDAIKVGLIVFLILLFSVPIFWLAFRLLGREESFGQVAAVPLTLVSSVSTILAITSPIVFLLSVLTGFSPEAVYVHIVIVDLAILVGLYLTGTLIYHAYENPKRLIIPNVVGFLMMGVVMVVLLNFLSPFLGLRSTFSVGTDRLKDGLGIGVGQKVSHALAAATSAEQVTYRFQMTNNNGDLVRDYTVIHLGNDNFIQLHLHAVPGETYYHEQRIWILDGQYFTDFDQGRVQQANPADLTTYIGPSLPPAVYYLPGEFGTASWRAFEGHGKFTAIGISQSHAQATLILEPVTGKLTSYILSSTDKGPHAETRILNIAPAELNREALIASLNQAIVLGSLKHSDASMQDFVQEEAYFIVRYPRNWMASNWNSDQRKVTFTTNCGADEGCPMLAVSTYEIVEGKDPQQYAEELGHSLELQPDYREIGFTIGRINGKQVGIVEYLFDQTVKGELKTTHHVEYIFVGQNYRYHLNFSAPEMQFESHRELFEAMAGMFTYLENLW